MDKNARFLVVGLQVGLQTGVTFFKKWGYTFGVLEGVYIEGATYRFEGVEWGKLPICDIVFCARIM